MTQDEVESLDKKMEELEPKVAKEKEYDDLIYQLSELISQRYPEGKEEVI